VKCDRRWWNDGRLEREIGAFARVELLEPLGFDGEPFTQLHWWEPEVRWYVSPSFLKTVPTMYMVKAC